MAFIRQRAFTILELIVVIAVMAVLTVMTVSITSSLRMANRDNKRVTDIRLIQASLEAYYRDYGYYPQTIVAGSPIATGTVTYLNRVPSNPPPANDGTCATNTDYLYTSNPPFTSYSLQFCLGARTADVGPGNNTAIPGDIVTCIPDCYMSCNTGFTAGVANNGSDGCGNICSNADTCSEGGYGCYYNHCVIAP